MKRDLSVLNKDVKEKIIKWLNSTTDDRKHYCPFAFSVKVKRDGFICKKLFPYIPLVPQENKKNWICIYKCPCSVYGVNYVTKVIRAIIEKN